MIRTIVFYNPWLVSYVLVHYIYSRGTPDLLFIPDESYSLASGHTVHCLGHDSILGPAIGPFLSMFIWRNFFFHIGESRAMKGVIFFSFSKFWIGVFLKKKSKKIKAVLRQKEFKTGFPELWKPFFKIWKIKKKLLLSLPSFRQNEGRENSFWINF